MSEMMEFLKRNRETLLFALCSVLLVHLIKFVNYYPCWDSMYGIEMKWAGMAENGRWLSGVAEILLSSKYDLQWVEGILSATFLSITITLIVNILDINGKKWRVIAILLFVVFPTFAATFNYGLWSPAYMLSLLLACLSVYICIDNSEKGINGIAILCVVISLAIYQIYILFATSLIVVYLINQLLKQKTEKTHMFRVVRQFTLNLVVGVAIYYIINKILQQIGGYELSSYQGIAEVGHMNWLSIVKGIIKIPLSFIRFFAGSRNLNAYLILNVIIAICIMGIMGKYVLFNNLYSKSHRFIICALYVLIVPITYAFHLVSPGVWYHRLMELGNYFIYVVPILVVMEHKKETIWKKYYITLICVLCFYHFVNDNIAYHQLSISYERTYFEASEVMMRVDQINDQNATKIMVIGHFTDANDSIVAIPGITGASPNNFLQAEFHLLQFAKYYLNRAYVSCPEEEREDIIGALDIHDMDQYPFGNYVQVIDDVVVIKLSEP